MIEWYKKKIKESEEAGDLQTMQDYQKMLRMVENRSEFSFKEEIKPEVNLPDEDDCESCKL